MTFLHEASALRVLWGGAKRRLRMRRVFSKVRNRFLGQLGDALP
jgi:hypothetical protein